MTIEERFQSAVERAAQSNFRVERRIERILHDDVPTFMEAPPYGEVSDPDIVVAGVPFEGIKIKDPRTFLPATARPPAGYTYARSGATEAPDAIRRQSMYYSLDHSGGLFLERERGFRIVDALRIADAGNLPIDHTVPPEQTLHAAADRLTQLVGQAAVPIIFGGDDTVPYVGVRAVARQRPRKLAIIKFDSHFDLSWEPRYWAGSQWARIFEAGYVAPANFAQLGLRGLRNSIMWYEAARELNLAYWTMRQIEEDGLVACVMAALEAVARDADALYLSLDLDVIDPAFLPAQKYPDPGGLTAREALRALRLVVDHGPPLAGFDMACLGPSFDVQGLGAQLAARCAVEVIGGIGLRRLRAARGDVEQAATVTGAAGAS